MVTETLMSRSARQKPVEAEDSTKRQKILKAAARSFLARGYRGTSMELVATESDVGRQTVYNQFASKRALFDATLALLWEEMPIDRIVSRTGTERVPERALLEIGNTIADFWAKEEAVAFLRMIISESIHFPELAESFFAFGQGSARRAVIEYLTILRDKKILHVADPDLAAAQFIGLINEPLLSSRIIGVGKSPSKERRKHVVEEAVQTFLARYGR
jgi:AcrR family transcriptional regulator